jgi:hypothetical protein
MHMTIPKKHTSLRAKRKFGRVVRAKVGPTSTTKTRRSTEAGLVATLASNLNRAKIFCLVNIITGLRQNGGILYEMLFF